MYIPWHELYLGRSFFVPSLDVIAARKEILLAAISNGVTCTATTGVYKGRHGVLITKINRYRAASK